MACVEEGGLEEGGQLVSLVPLRLGSSIGFLAVSLALATASIAARAADSAGSPDQAYLDALGGAWVMAGTIGSKPVRYRAEGVRVLQGGFLRLHMIDVVTPPEYEADVYIGYDAKAHDYVAHWMDRFGAAGARVVARGDRQGEKMVLTFPYSEGAFRDTFVWFSASDSWTLLLEAQDPDGAWSTFASYTLTRETSR
jgi:hypothetical protein